MPSTPLETIPHEFRPYGPLPHRQFLSHINSSAQKLGVYDVSNTAKDQRVKLAREIERWSKERGVNSLAFLAIIILCWVVGSVSLSIRA